MLTRFGEFQNELRLFEELRRRMDRLWDDFDTYFGEPGGRPAQGGLPPTTWPPVNLYDAGANLVVSADVPGMNDKSLQVSLGNDTLSVSGERKSDAPEGYAVHRQERAAVKFARSFSLPCKVDAERIAASVKDGILTITLPKAPEAQPRQIAVSSP